MNLRAAIVFSILFHLGLMIIRPPPSFIPPRELLHPLEVSYQSVSLDAEPPRAVPKPPVPVVRSSSAADLPPTGGGTSTSVVAIPRPAQQPKPRVPEPPRDLPDPPTPTARLSPEVAAPSSEGAVAVGLPEGEFASIEHKEWVRQHLKAHLQYPYSRLSGAVRLQLVLAPHGILKEVTVLESSDPRLTDLAVKDAQLAVPYPRFPKEMKQRQVRYEFLVKYQPE